ncbi:MAG: DUF3303 domain-containing protein [Acidimicrobiales bacterium]
MKFMIVSQLADTDDATRSSILELYAEHGVPPGTEGLWLTADGQKVVQLVEADDLTEFSRFSNLYRTGFAAGTATWYPLVDAEVAVGHQIAGIEARNS